MNFNFFDWIRDGVKRAVLLGVSDAAQTIGMPHEEESSKEKILSFLQSESHGDAVVRKRITNPGGSTASQRKLGRSISDIHPVKEAS